MDGPIHPSVVRASAGDTAGMRASATGRASPHGTRRSWGPGRRGGDRTAQLPYRRYGGDGLQVVHDLRVLNALQLAGGEQEGLDVEVRSLVRVEDLAGASRPFEAVVVPRHRDRPQADRRAHV